MATFPLIRNPEQTIVDDADAAFVGQFRLYLQRKNGKPASVRLYLAGAMVKLHRVLMDAPPGMVVDHINRNPLDNRRENLRVCRPQENNLNRRASTRNRSGFKGVYEEAKTSVKRCWRAEIKVDGRKIRLGTFSSPEAAAEAYDRASKQHHRGFGVTNRELNAA